MGISNRIEPAVALLWQAQLLALDLERHAWDFAVEIDCLRASGLTNSDLRWLVGRGLVEHAHETTSPCEDRRTFSLLGKMTLTAATCFVLTPAGVALARELTGDTSGSVLPQPHGAGGNGKCNGSQLADVPTWNRDRQELRFQGMLVKQFKLPAPNQEIVLATFEEEHWPARIDDPLPGSPNMDAKRRLHETIASLNRNQKHRLIQFIGDGSGEGVRWEPAGVPPSADGRA